MNLPYIVEVQEAVEQITAEGYVTRSYRRVGTKWAEVEALKSSERVQATAVQGTLTHKITMRNGGRIPKPKDRIIHKGKTYEIDGVVPEFRKPGKATATAVEVV